MGLKIREQYKAKVDSLIFQFLIDTIKGVSTLGRTHLVFPFQFLISTIIQLKACRVHKGQSINAISIPDRYD